MRLLNIESSPRRSRSASIAVTSAFLEAYRQACPGVVVDTLNVWEEKLPDFDQEAIGAKYKGINKEPMDPAEAAVWNKIQELAARFQQADRIVLGVPMWNFAYPYKLKQLIDLACQRNMLFTYDGNEYGPLLKTPRVFVVYARGGTYAEDSPTPASKFDHQKGYIDFWLKFIGVKEVQTLVVEGTTWPEKEKTAMGETGRTGFQKQCTDDPYPAELADCSFLHMKAIGRQGPPLSTQGPRLAILKYQGSDPTQPYPTFVVRQSATLLYGFAPQRK